MAELPPLPEKIGYAALLASGAGLAALAVARAAAAFGAPAPLSGFAAWPVLAFAVPGLAAAAWLAFLRLRREGFPPDGNVPAAPGGDGEGAFWALVVGVSAAAVLALYAGGLSAPFDAEASLYRFDAAARASGAPLSGPSDRMLGFGYGLYPANAALWRGAATVLGDNPAAMRAALLGGLMLAAAALAGAARALGLSGRAALAAAALLALHPYHALAATSPAYGIARILGLLLVPLYLWRAVRGREPGAIAGPMTAAALLAALLWMHPQLWALGLLPLWLEAIDPREGEKGVRRLYRAGPGALLAVAGFLLAPPRLTTAGVPDPTPFRSWLAELPRLADFTAAPVANLDRAAFTASLLEGAPNFLLGRGLSAATAGSALLLLATLALLALRGAPRPRTLGTVLLVALALSAPGGARGLAEWTSAQDPRFALLAIPFALLLGAALAPERGGRGVQAAAWLLLAAWAGGLGALSARSAAPLRDVARAHHRFVNEFDRLHRPRLAADAAFVFLGTDTHDRGVLLADATTLRAEMGRRKEPASGATVAMPDHRDPFVAGEAQISALAWGEKAFVLRWDPALLAQEDLTQEFLRRRKLGAEDPPPPVIWEGAGLEAEWTPFGGRLSNEPGTPLEIAGEGRLGLASKELNLRPEGRDYVEIKWKGDWAEPGRPAGELPAQFEWRAWGAERVFMLPFALEVSGEWRLARIPVARSLSWLLGGNVRSLTIRVDSPRPVRVSFERVAIRRASREGMIYVPPGTFLMGSAPDDYNRYDKEPVARERFVRGFWIDVYEYPNEKGVVPRIDVDWVEARGLCEALGKRLCAEAEWEKACKGPEMRRYPYGDDYDKAKCWTDQDFDKNLPKPAGSFPECVSGYGVYDMAGNVSEWTSDGWTRDEIAAVKGLASYGTLDNWDRLPVPWLPLLKGGDWGEASEDTRCAGHNHYHLPTSTYRDDGLRCCMDAE